MGEASEEVLRIDRKGRAAGREVGRLRYGSPRAPPNDVNTPLSLRNVGLDPMGPTGLIATASLTDPAQCLTGFEGVTYIDPQ